MTITFLTLFLLISFISNLILVWYIRKLIQEFEFMSSNVGSTTESLSDFVGHLERLYELETYYGDESLKSLIVHSKELLDDIRGFETVISSIDKEIIENETEEEN
jgi:RNase H-fold protein (predicted Holliday junction resolvase)